jgi:hypothetical protein
MVLERKSMFISLSIFLYYHSFFSDKDRKDGADQSPFTLPVSFLL